MPRRIPDPIKAAVAAMAFGNFTTSQIVAHESVAGYRIISDSPHRIQIEVRLLDASPRYFVIQVSESY